jgi:tetratricopeptide (TPR) repeat protein
MEVMVSTPARKYFADSTQFLSELPSRLEGFLKDKLKWMIGALLLMVLLPVLVLTSMSYFSQQEVNLGMSVAEMLAQHEERLVEIYEKAEKQQAQKKDGLEVASPMETELKAAQQAFQADVHRLLEQAKAKGLKMASWLTLLESGLSLSTPKEESGSDAWQELEQQVEKIIPTSTKNVALSSIAAEQRIILMEKQGKWDSAIEHLTQAKERMGETFYTPYVLYHAALLALQEKNPTQAKALLEDAMQAYPNSAVYADLKAQLSLITGLE